METNKAKILCVDDEPLNIRLLEAILSPQGYEVLGAASGQEAPWSDCRPCLLTLFFSMS